MMKNLKPELLTTLKRLKLGKLAETLPTRLHLAREQQMDVEDVLQLVLHDEVSRREGNGWCQEPGADLC